MTSTMDIEALRKLSLGDAPLGTMDQNQVEQLRCHVFSEQQKNQKEIRDLEARLNELKEGQQRRSEQIRLLQRISWADLPPEILSQIFRHLKGKVHFPVDESDIVWTISRVCLTWRRVVMAEQRLWSDVYLIFNSKHRDARALKSLNDLLHRSGHQLVSLTLDCEQISWNHTRAGGSIPLFVVVVICTVNRAVSLTLINLSHSVLDELYSTLKDLGTDVFPQVTELKISPSIVGRGTSYIAGRCPSASLLCRMSNVTNVILGGGRDCISSSFTEFKDYPWSQFRRITLLKYQPSIGEVLEILLQTRNLRAFKTQLGVNEGMSFTRWDPVPDSVKLPVLEELDIILSLEEVFEPRPHGIVFNAFFSPLLAPRLSKLTISSLKFGSEYRQLHMMDEGINAMSCLCAFKSLTSLELNGCFDVDIDLLLRELPRLAHLFVHPARSNQLTRPAIEVMTSRLYGVNLRTLCCCIAERDIIPFLAMLEQQWIESPPSIQAAPPAGIHQASMFVDYDGQSLAMLNKLARKLKEDLRADPGVKFFALDSHHVADDTDNDSEYDSYFL